MGDGAVIALEDVHKRLGGREVHRGIWLDVRRGEILTLVGGSGQGKSVLLKEIIGLLKPDRGRILIDGEDITALRERDLLRVRRRVGMLFQGAALFDHMTVFDNIAFPLRQHGVRDAERIAARVAETLRLVDLPGIEQMMPEELSGGMRKRVGLARAIATEPDIVLYDEPTTGLDPRSARRILDLIVRLRADLGVTSVMVTHDLAVARAATDRLALLHEGKIVAVGPWQEVAERQDPAVRRFFDGFEEEAAP